MFKMPDFTKKDIDYLIENCNFSDDEEKVFRMRCKNRTLEEIAEEMNVCYKTAYRYNRRVKNKIIKVL